jgi:4-amino-4-deoxy-L-arabinose transferase-like glycosyltransferase
VIRRWRIAILVALGILYLSGVWLLPLQEPDEGRYGDIAASMARTGDWLTPRLNGIRYYEKPPLYFWLGAACVSVLGPTEAAVRLPSALACLATVLLLMRWGRRAGGENVELLAGAMGGTLPLFALFAHMAMVDLAMTFLTTLALYSFWRGVVESQEARRPWIHVFWLACALAMLAKGPVGVALPLISVLGWLALARSWDRVRAFIRPDGIAIFVLVAAPWFLAMESANPGYLREFFVGQNYARAVAGSMFDRDAPPWFYLAVLATYFLPWALFLPGAVRTLKLGRADELSPEARLRLFLACSILFPLAILSIAQSKIGYYLLPLAPPIALLAATRAAESWGADGAVDDDRPWRKRSLVLSGFAALCVVVAVVAAVGARQDAGELNARWGRKGVGPDRVKKGREFIAEVQGELPLAAGAALLAGAGLVGAAALVRRRRAVESLITASLALALLEISALAIASRLPPLYTARTIARCLEARAAPGEPIVLLEEYMTSIPYYLRRPVTISDATFPMFGHAVGDLEAEGLSLQDRPERLGPLLERHPSVLVVCRSADGEERARQAGRGSWESLDQVGRFTILRHRSR